VSQTSHVAHGLLGPSEEAVVAASARTPSAGQQMDEAETNRRRKRLKGLDNIKKESDATLELSFGALGVGVAVWVGVH
jgi:hypothetical protein